MTNLFKIIAIVAAIGVFALLVCCQTQWPFEPTTESVWTQAWHRAEVEASYRGEFVSKAVKVDQYGNRVQIIWIGGEVYSAEPELNGYYF